MRRRIERDLHDGVQQRLVSLMLLLAAAQARVPPELDELRVSLQYVTARLEDALDELREMARGIHPSILTQGGLVPALKVLARRSLLPVDLMVHTEGTELPMNIQVSAYYIVCEALTNAIKHAQASTVTVLKANDEVLDLSIQDDGNGGADFARGTGLVGIKDRVATLGGRISVDSPHGAGTALRAELPLFENGRVSAEPAQVGD
ncbi:histidine kinase [Streptomyces sp. NPDC002896]|uniref:sensor histidine kinase n=1 Tax=Streptomyces sp. NPDC002896 TaxID=3154438 RepID=UPI003332F750